MSKSPLVSASRLAALLSAAALASGLACEPSVSVEAVCEHAGIKYEPGDTLDDGCNTCTCLDDGALACTKIACSPARCTHEGYFHEVGDVWQSFDQCLSCACPENGETLCTQNGPCETCFYAGVLRQHGESFPSLDGCNTCACDHGAVVCTKIACPCDPEKEWRAL